MTLAGAGLLIATWLFGATATGAATAARCTTDYTPIEHELNAARERWTAAQIATYNYRFARTCLCDDRVAGPFRVRVEGGLVRAAIYQGAAAAGIPDGTRAAEPDLASIIPIDRVFNLIAGAVAKKACSIQVTYDPALGYPAKLDIDFDPDTADEEMRLTIGDVRPASGTPLASPQGPR